MKRLMACNLARAPGSLPRGVKTGGGWLRGVHGSGYAIRMMSDAWAICREIRALRGWTQRRLAEAAGVAHSTVARIEKARMEPTLSELQRLARAAGFDLRIEIAPVDPDSRKSRQLARGLTDEERLVQNDRLSALRTRARV